MNTRRSIDARQRALDARQKAIERQNTEPRPASNPRRRSAAPPPAETPSDSPAPPTTLPQPWLVDTETLLQELTRCRELLLRIPTSIHTHLPVQNAVDANWRLEEWVRFTLQIHRESQSAFRRAAHDATQPQDTSRQLKPSIALRASG